MSATICHIYTFAIILEIVIDKFFNNVNVNGSLIVLLIHVVTTYTLKRIHENE